MIDSTVDFVMRNLAEMLDTPAGEGELSGLVDRNGVVLALVDLGERLPGGIPVLGAFEIHLTPSPFPKGKGSLNLEGAVQVARDGAMESDARQQRTLESCSGKAGGR